MTVLGYAVLVAAAVLLLVVFGANCQLAVRRATTGSRSSTVVGVGTVALIVALIVYARLVPDGWRPPAWSIAVAIAIDLLGPLVVSFVVAMVVRPDAPGD